MRCKICDWSPTGPQSDYFHSLSTPSDAQRLLDPETKEVSCNCFDRDDNTEGLEMDEDFDPMEDSHD